MLNTRESYRPDATSGATLPEVMSAVGFGNYQYIVFTVIAICGFSDGMEVLVMAFIFAPLQRQWGISEYHMGVLGSLVFTGVFIGSWCGGVIGDRIGRKKQLEIGVVTVFIFGLVSSFCPNFESFTICRFLVGLGLGVVGPAAFSIATEYCPKNHRGFILVCIGQMFSIGEMIESMLAAFIMTSDDEEHWRKLVAWSAAPSLLSMILVYVWVPESPLYLSVTGKSQELHQLLASMAKSNGTEEALAQTLGGGVLRGIERQGHRNDHLGKPMELLTGNLRHTTLLLWFIWFVQSFVYYGLTFILPYAIPIVTHGAKSGIVSDNVYWTSFIASAAELPGAALAAVLTDVPVIGRRHALTGFMGVSALFAVIAAAGASDFGAFIFGVVAAKCMINGSFSLAWTYTAEVYPTVERSTGLGSCSAMSRVGGICTPLLSTVLIRNGVWMPFALYGVVSVLGACASSRLTIETQGRDLQNTTDVLDAQDEDESVSLLMTSSTNMPADMRTGSYALPDSQSL